MLHASFSACGRSNSCGVRSWPSSMIACLVSQIKQLQSRSRYLKTSVRQIQKSDIKQRRFELLKCFDFGLFVIECRKVKDRYLLEYSGHCALEDRY